MDPLNARPHVLKQANLSLIRNVIQSHGTATRAEIAENTNISSTTIRSLLSEMIQRGEIESVGFDTSQGGRKAERYRFNPDQYYSAAFCIKENLIHCLLVNIRGEILDTAILEAPDESYEPVITAYLDRLLSQRQIRSIGLGVPGVVEGGCFWRKNKENDELYKNDIGEKLAGIYRLPVVMENDINATAIGFKRCYEKEFPYENPECTNMAYLYFEKGCVNAGLLSGGRIIRGCHNFAGEIGLVPMSDRRLLDDWMDDPLDDPRYTELVIQIICWICGVLNPQYVVLGGPQLRTSCIGPIGDGLSAVLPKWMFAEVLSSSDSLHDYYDGMAWLTAGKMFDQVHFVRE